MRISVQLTAEEEAALQAQGQEKTPEQLMLDRLNDAGSEYLKAAVRDMHKDAREEVLAAVDDPIQLAKLREVLK